MHNGPPFVSVTRGINTSVLNVSTPLSQWEELKNVFGEFKGKKFLDIGHGFGNIVLLAANLGLVSHGVEIDSVTHSIAKENYAAARALGYIDNATLYYGDVFKIDISSYDLFYHYHLIKRESLLHYLENHCKAGAVLLLLTREMSIERVVLKEWI